MRSSVFQPQARQFRTAAVFCLALACVFPRPAAAASLWFDDFSDTTDLVFNGAAATSSSGEDSVLRLTSWRNGKHGSAFTSTRVRVARFSTFFQLRITNAPSDPPGLAFVIQSVSPAFLGGDGSYLGYGSPSFLYPSVAVEFDLTNSYPYDTDSNHVGILKDGNVQDHLARRSVTPNMAMTGLWSVWLDYDGATLNLRLANGADRPLETFLSIDVDMPNDFAYVGFTAATGTQYTNQDIVTWEFSEALPEPSTSLLFGIGLLAAASWSRRRARQKKRCA